MPEGHPFMTALDVYERLRNPDRVQPAPTLPMRIGSHLESGILALAAEHYGWQVRANHRTHKHRSVPLCATPDARILGTSSLVEIKYSARAENWASLPAHVYWQAQAQMACQHRITSVIVVVLAAGRLIRFDVARDKTASRRLCAATVRLCAAVAAGVPPSAIPPLAALDGLYLDDIPLSLRRRHS
jgi:hypothetical protein